MQTQVEQTFLFREPGDAPPTPYSEDEQRRRNSASDACWAELRNEFGTRDRVISGDGK